MNQEKRKEPISTYYSHVITSNTIQLTTSHCLGSPLHADPCYSVNYLPKASALVTSTLPLADVMSTFLDFGTPARIITTAAALCDKLPSAEREEIEKINLSIAQKKNSNQYLFLFKQLTYLKKKQKNPNFYYSIKKRLKEKALKRLTRKYPIKNLN